MIQRTSNKGMMEIIAHEAIVLSPYRDVKDIWTIGVGHTKMAGGIDPAKFSGQLTLAGALHILRTDLSKYERRVAKAFTRPLTQNQFDAAVSFDFNTGAIDRATWVESFNAGNTELAVQQIMNWQKPPQIIPRRQKEQALFASAKYEANGKAMVYPATKSGVVLWNKGQQIKLSAIPDVSVSSHERGVSPQTKGFLRRILAWFKRLFFAV